jgi:hypothetical protein
MGAHDPPPDFGTITIHSPQDDILLVHLADRASKNTENPGQAWGRIEANRVRDGRTEKGVKKLHLDTRRGLLTVAEEWDGVETARQTIDRAGPRGPIDVPTGPTPPPDPGPAEPAYFRMPFHAADLLPEDELRDWVKERADQDVVNVSVLPRRILLFGGRFQEVVALPRACAANVAPGTGATLRALSTREGIERRFVEGWFGSVDGRGTAWILEVDEGDAWWLAMRTFERRPGMIGVWTSAWVQRVGRGSDALPSSLRGVIGPPADEPAIELGTPKAPEPPTLGMFGGTLRPDEEVPSTAEAVADRVGRDWEAKFPVEGSIDGARFTVFRGREWETWELKGEFPMGLDDMLRAICARGVEPTSVALTRMGVIPLEGDVHRALLTSGEAQGERWTRALAIGLTPEGRVFGHRMGVQKHGAIGDDGWIGVEPITDLELFTLGAGEA